MTDMPHFVFRQTLEFETNQTQGKEELSDRVSQLARRIAVLLEKILNTLDDPEQVIQLDKVDIELEFEEGTSMEHWNESKLEQAIYQAVRAAMDKHSAVIKSKVEIDVENATFFLMHGFLPWNMPEKYSLAALEYRLSEALALERLLSGKLVQQLQYTTALQRLLRQFSIQMPWRILEALRPGMEARLRQKWSGKADKGRESERLAFWKTVFEAQTIVAENLEQKIARQLKYDQEQEPETKKDLEKTSESAVFINNAGLILLHPYLPTLFEELGFVHEGKVEQKDKALFALQYAVCGKTTAPEWELAFPKILCGVPLKESAWRSSDLDKSACEEIDNMLQAVIIHWDVLKNSSIDGLREGFLQRNGRLTESDDYWLLRVEQKSYDMLLDQLPWGLGIVKLPWMNKPVYTEWV